MSTKEHIYTIARAYRSCTVWSCDNKTRRRQCQVRLTPNKGLSRIERYNEIARFLECFAPVPAYKKEGAP